MTNEQKEALIVVKHGLQYMATTIKDQNVPEPARAILSAQLFLLVSNVRHLLGEKKTDDL